MSRMTVALVAASLMAVAGVANAANLSAGIYNSQGYVVSATSQCSAVGLSQGAGNFSIFRYPGASKSGFTLYSPAFGVLQLCSGFSAVPAGGLNGYNSNASCTTYSAGGTIPAETVNFAFTATTTDANSGVGTTTITIPANAPVGGGCTATVNTAVVRSGK